MLTNLLTIFILVISAMAVYQIFRLLFKEISAEEKEDKKQSLSETFRSTARANDLSAASYDEKNSILATDIAGSDDLHLISNYQTRETDTTSISDASGAEISERSDPERFDDLHTLSSFQFHESMPEEKEARRIRRNNIVLQFPKKDIIQL